MADLLVGVTGDFVPAREVLRPGTCSISFVAPADVLPCPTHDDRPRPLPQRARPLRLRHHRRHDVRRGRARRRHDGERVLLGEPAAAARARSCVDHAASMFDALRGADALRRQHPRVRAGGAVAPLRGDRVDAPVRRARLRARRERRRCCSTTRSRTSSAGSLRAHEAGDHTLFIGEVERAVARGRAPLLYYRGGYAQLER